MVALSYNWTGNIGAMYYRVGKTINIKGILMKTLASLLSLCLCSCMLSSHLSAETLGQYQSHTVGNGVEILSTTPGQRLELTAYGDRMVRVQAVNNGAAFSDPAYPMVDPSVQWTGSLNVVDRGSDLEVTTSSGAVTVHVQKNPLRIEFVSNGVSLKEAQGIEWLNGRVDENLAMGASERFVGLGHGNFGHVGNSLNLRGQIIARNYGPDTQSQSPLIVPFFISSAGYGIFLNSTFTNRFDFTPASQYQFGVTASQMDYFYIAGPAPADVLERYTALTGRPHLPQLAIFGLALSDKGDPANPGATWWQSKVAAHRSLGLPLDHLVNDNRWRIGAGERCNSEFGWDPVRYPSPEAFHTWLREQGLVTTLDFNRCIAPHSPGWLPSFNIDNANLASLHATFHESSAPDFTNPTVANWWWSIIRDKGLDPTRDYPGDALWIDEFDALGAIPGATVMGDGHHWDEARNAWFLTIAKTLGDNWSRDIGIEKRPFTWIRGGTAGGQRYATLWSGDTNSEYSEMRDQVRGLLSAGLSGFPYQGHDGGGFHTTAGFTSNLYRQWAMAFGSFTPYWRPHGDTAASRWPMDQTNSAAVIADAKKYGDLRYALMPYTYTLAWQAHNTGIPMARAMLLEFPQSPEAWQFDQQFMWGSSILVAPNSSDANNVSLWLPSGTWYDYWSGEALTGGGTLSYPAPTGKLPLFVKAGGILPMTTPALSTKFMSRSILEVHAYVGANGDFTLYEDDGVSERHQQGAQRFTALHYSESDGKISVDPTLGDFAGATATRRYSFHWHGLSAPQCVIANGTALAFAATQQLAQTNGGAFWNATTHVLSAYTAADLSVQASANATFGSGCKLPQQNFTSVFPTVNLRGTSNAWGNTPMALVANNTWEIVASFTGTVTGGHRFKFDVKGDWTVNFGDTNKDGIADASGADIATPGTGTFTIRFNDNSRAYTVATISASSSSRSSSSSSSSSVSSSSSSSSVSSSSSKSSSSSSSISSFSSSSSASGTVPVTFTCSNGTTYVGQSVYVAGSVAGVGNWVVASAVKLSPNPYPTWKGTIQLPANTSIQWKCLKREEANPANGVVWQGGANNTVNTGTAGASTSGSF